MHITQGRLEAAEERVSELKIEVITKEQRIHDLEMDTRPLHMRDLERDNEAMSARICDLERDNEAMTARNRDLERDSEAKTARIRDLVQSDTMHKAVRKGGQKEWRKKVIHTQEKLHLPIIRYGCITLMIAVTAILCVMAIF